MADVFSQIQKCDLHFSQCVDTLLCDPNHQSKGFRPLAKRVAELGILALVTSGYSPFLAAASYIAFRSALTAGDALPQGSRRGQSVFYPVARHTADFIDLLCIKTVIQASANLLAGGTPNAPSIITSILAITWIGARGADLYGCQGKAIPLALAGRPSTLIGGVKAVKTKVWRKYNG